MNMKKRATGKRIGSMLMTLALMVAMIAPGVAMPTYAAAPGGSIYITYNPGVDDLKATNFTLYHVSGFDSSSGTSTLVPEGWVSASGADLDIAVPETEEEKAEGSEWNKKWLSSAQTLATYLNSLETKPESAWSGTLTPGVEAQKIGGTYEGGIYLLVGEEQKIGDKIWWPVPVLIQVLNGDTNFKMTNQELKMGSKAAIYKHTVTKMWNPDDPEDAMPEAINFGIKYGDTQIDTVVLNKANNWSYTWYSYNEESGGTYTSKDPEDKDAVGVATKILNEGNNFAAPYDPASGTSWQAYEMRETDDDRDNVKYYSVVTTSTPFDQDSIHPAETFTVTNTFATSQLKITKHLENYLSQAGANATVVFKVTGKIGSKTVYENNVGMTFTGKGDQTITLKNLPYDLDELTVEEVYATNYKVEGKAVKTYKAGSENNDIKYTVTDGVNLYEVDFTNNVDETVPTYNSGIVNIYKDGKYTGSRDTGAASEQ